MSKIEKIDLRQLIDYKGQTAQLFNNYSDPVLIEKINEIIEVVNNLSKQPEE